MTKGLTVQLHMYRSCPRTQAISNCLKDYFWRKKNQEYLKQTINLKEIKPVCPIVLNAKSLKIH